MIAFVVVALFSVASAGVVGPQFAPAIGAYGPALAAPAYGPALAAPYGLAAPLAAPAIAAPIAVAAPVAKVLNTGASSQSRQMDNLGNYAFNYNEAGLTGGSSRSEAGNALGQVVGSYSLSAADGRQRVVKYVADAAGFRAAISTNEPGTAAAPAAATSVNGIHAPVPVAVAAPIVAKVAAPLAYAAAPAIAKVGLAAPIAHAGYAAAPIAQPLYG